MLFKKKNNERKCVIHTYFNKNIYISLEATKCQVNPLLHLVVGAAKSKNSVDIFILIKFRYILLRIGSRQGWTRGVLIGGQGGGARHETVKNVRSNTLKTKNLISGRHGAALPPISAPCSGSEVIKFIYDLH